MTVSVDNKICTSCAVNLSYLFEQTLLRQNKNLHLAVGLSGETFYLIWTVDSFVLWVLQVYPYRSSPGCQWRVQQFNLVEARTPKVLIQSGQSALRYNQLCDMRPFLVLPGRNKRPKRFVYDFKSVPSLSRLLFTAGGALYENTSSQRRPEFFLPFYVKRLDVKFGITLSRDGSFGPARNTKRKLQTDLKI